VKFNRNYRFLIQRQDLNVQTILPPFTIEFDIHRNSFSSASAASFRIYNLAEQTRAALRLDEYDYDNKNREIEFYAGYGNNLSLGFKGVINHAWSVREGVNMITQIESFDGGYAYLNAVTDAQFPDNVQNQSIIDAVVKNLGGWGVQKGAIGDFSGTTTKGQT